MHIIIYTQYRENYGDSVSPYWKNKGGHDYVLWGVDTKFVTEFAKSAALRQNIFSLVEYANSGSEERVIDWNIRDGDYVSNDDLVSPIYMHQSIEGQWVAMRRTLNMGQMTDVVESMSEAWVMLPGAERAEYRKDYIYFADNFK